MVSVVTVTFNNFHELEKTLSSLRGVKGVESVVINGGSCEQTLKYLTDNPALRSRSEPDQGISDGFNRGVNLATSPYIAFLNSGDQLLDRTYYQRASEYLDQNPSVDFIYSDLSFVDSVAGPISFRGSEPSLSAIGAGMPFGHPTVVARKSLFDRVGLFKLDYRIAMDYEWLVRVLQVGARGSRLESTSLLMDGTGVSAKREGQAIQECERALKEHGLFHGRVSRDYHLRQFKYRLRSMMGPRALAVVKKLKYGGAKS